MSTEDQKVLDVLAHAFLAEGVEAVFALLGDANMYWAETMSRAPGVKVVHARHEHCACAMADGYARATGKVGVASTTCGPGFTQIITALTAAAHARTPMVIFAGEAPLSSNWYLQHIEVAPLTQAAGGIYLPIRHVDTALDTVREAFYRAQAERRPVVLGVPMDLQKQPWPHWLDYATSASLLPVAQRPAPDARLVTQVADLIAAAERPIIVAGRGATRSGAGPLIARLAGQCGALVSSTLLAKGLFDGDPFSLDIAGAFGSDLAHEYFADADLVIGIGAGLGHYTTEAGYLYPEAKVVRIDLEPKGFWQGLRTADVHVQADALAATQALLAELEQRTPAGPRLRTEEIRAAIAQDQPDGRAFPARPGVIDPRKAVRELNGVIPPDWDIVVGSGHYNSFVMTHLQGRAPGKYHLINDFGAVGSGLAAAIGVAAARGNGQVVLVEGDGSLMMHVQELETIVRQGIRLLIVVMNDGGYGAEFHKFRATGVAEAEAVHGRGNLAGVASAFGLDGSSVDASGRLQALFDRYRGGGKAALIDVHIDDRIASRSYRKIHFGEA